MKGKVCLFLLSCRLSRSACPNSLDSSFYYTNLVVSPDPNLGPIGSPDSKPGPLVVAIGSKGPWSDSTFPDSTMFIGLAAKGHVVLVLVLQQEVQLRLVFAVLAGLLLLLSCFEYPSGVYQQFGSLLFQSVLSAVAIAFV